MATLTKQVVEQCRKKLLEKKMELLNRMNEGRKQLYIPQETTGDEADQSVRILEEAEAVAQQERLRSTLVEIEFALARIDSGSYGICEETEEPIEADRLLAIPWTRLSIEGAEVRESVNKRYAR